jgi:type VI secretion system protein ImpA
VVDLAPWLDPLDGESPSGESLRRHERFIEIEELLQPRYQAGAASDAALPPDWTGILERADELRSKGRDLRLLVIVARALANQQGLPGLADGLTLIAKTVEAHWDTLHPELRAAPNPREAARPRTNAVMELRNPKGLLGDLRSRVYFTVPGLGPVTGDDLERGALDARTVLLDAAQGLPASEQAQITAAHQALVSRVRTAVAWQSEHAPAERTALAEAAGAALAALDELEAALSAKLGDTVSLSEKVDGRETGSPRRFLTRMLATLDKHAPAAPPSPGPVPEGTRQPAPPAGGVGEAGPIPGRLGSRDEVIVCLDRIIDFYDRTEPASPVPYLARRMRRMVRMDFLALMEDLAPSGLKEFRTVAGIADDKKASSRAQGEGT